MSFKMFINDNSRYSPMSFFYMSGSVLVLTMISCHHYTLRVKSRSFLDEEMGAQMFGSCPRSHTLCNMKPRFRAGALTPRPRLCLWFTVPPLGQWGHQPSGQVSAGMSYTMTLTACVSESQSWWARGQAEVGCVHWWLAMASSHYFLFIMLASRLHPTPQKEVSYPLGYSAVLEMILEPQGRLKKVLMCVSHAVHTS